MRNSSCPALTSLPSLNRRCCKKPGGGAGTCATREASTRPGNSVTSPASPGVAVTTPTSTGGIFGPPAGACASLFTQAPTTMAASNESSLWAGTARTVGMGVLWGCFGIEDRNEGRNEGDCDLIFLSGSARTLPYATITGFRTGAMRGCSSVDRVLASEAKGRGFDPRQPHHSPLMMRVGQSTGSRRTARNLLLYSPIPWRGARVAKGGRL